MPRGIHRPGVYTFTHTCTHAHTHAHGLCFSLLQSRLKCFSTNRGCIDPGSHAWEASGTLPIPGAEPRARSWLRAGQARLRCEAALVLEETAWVWGNPLWSMFSGTFPSPNPSSLSRDSLSDAGARTPTGVRLGAGPPPVLTTTGSHRAGEPTGRRARARSVLDRGLCGCDRAARRGRAQKPTLQPHRDRPGHGATGTLGGSRRSGGAIGPRGKAAGSQRTNRQHAI